MIKLPKKEIHSLQKSLVDVLIQKLFFNGFSDLYRYQNPFV